MLVFDRIVWPFFICSVSLKGFVVSLVLGVQIGDEVSLLGYLVLNLSMI